MAVLCSGFSEQPVKIYINGSKAKFFMVLGLVLIYNGEL
jgi:hypothetical protein